MYSLQTQDVAARLVYCWPTVYDSGSTLSQRWFSLLCLRLVSCFGQNNNRRCETAVILTSKGYICCRHSGKLDPLTVNPLSAGDAFKRIHTVFPQLKFNRN